MKNNDTKLRKFDIGQLQEHIAEAILAIRAAAVAAEKLAESSLLLPVLAEHDNALCELADRVDGLR